MAPNTIRSKLKNSWEPAKKPLAVSKALRKKLHYFGLHSILVYDSRYDQSHGTVDVSPAEGYG